MKSKTDTDQNWETLYAWRGKYFDPRKIELQLANGRKETLYVEHEDELLLNRKTGKVKLTGCSHFLEDEFTPALSVDQLCFIAKHWPDQNARLEYCSPISWLEMEFTRAKLNVLIAEMEKNALETLSETARVKVGAKSRARSATRGLRVKRNTGSPAEPAPA